MPPLARPSLAALLALCAFAAVERPPAGVGAANVPITTCRSFCGNITVDYPFALRAGCGHAGFRELLYCINGALMLHLPSGSYRVLDIDYAYRGLTLHDPAMSDCRALDRSRGGRGNGFVVEPWRAPYLAPDPDNVFLLLGCRASSPLFQGFPDRHLPCRNVSGMGCGEYYGCPAWDDYGGRRPSGAAYGAAAPTECCAVSWDAIRAVNANRGFCGACRATGGVCGHDGDSHGDLCLCGDWNSTSNCDSSADAARPNAASAAPRAIVALCLGVLASGFSFL
ncbi:hypothetical protein OsI_19941 [Oryza sativa Indica Group]|uniref:Wall-associated receptor kinase galacturonan-binding domain-containing protein n=1 Tax=Oryza sativa subsp. indica TaxID=39946 RepID=A2Y4L6_ORYSI|nr:hypothetical protein OsI_19941 [Oryza sativa Indica Group]